MGSETDLKLVREDGPLTLQYEVFCYRTDTSWDGTEHVFEASLKPDYFSKEEIKSKTVGTKLFYAGRRYLVTIEDISDETADRDM